MKKTITKLMILIITGIILFLAACGSGENAENGNYGTGANLGEATPSPTPDATPTPSPTPRPTAPPEIMGLHPPGADQTPAIELPQSLTPDEPLSLTVMPNTISAGYSMSAVIDTEGRVWTWGGQCTVPSSHDFLYTMARNARLRPVHIWHTNGEQFVPNAPPGGFVVMFGAHYQGGTRYYHLRCADTMEWIDVRHLIGTAGRNHSSDIHSVMSNPTPPTNILELLLAMPDYEELALMATPRRLDYSAVAVQVCRFSGNFFTLCEEGNLYSGANHLAENIASFNSSVYIDRVLFAGLQVASMVLEKDGSAFVRHLGIPGDATMAGNPRMIALADGENHMLMLAYNYELFGSGSGFAVGVINRNEILPPTLILENVAQIAAAAEHSMALTHDNRLYAWGRNTEGRLGIGSRVNNPTPTFVMDNVIAIAAGERSSFAITSDGTLYGWGCNRFGQLGIENANPALPSQTRPVPIMENIALVSAGAAHTLAVTHDGVLYAWGRNTSGQVGDGTNYNRFEPIRIMEGVKLP